MINSEEIRQKAKNKYQSYLRSIMNEEVFFPLIIIGNKKPSDNINDFRKEIVELEDNSKNVKGYGYSVVYEVVKTKNLGEQNLPQQIVFDSEYDYLKFISKINEVANFRKNTEKILSLFPETKDWITKYPQRIIENNEKWEDLIKVCKYFKSNPRPNLYIRELPIEVHTKFVEQNKGIIKELLDIIIADFANPNESDFLKRFNLKYEEPSVRFRILDQELSDKRYNSWSELTIPLSQFVAKEIEVSKVFIVENKMTMLTFPIVDNSIVIWGHGFEVSMMKQVGWLKNKTIYYWGDIDAQGFEILSSARTHFPQIVSFLMDRKTFDAYFENDCGTPSKVTAELKLTAEEYDIYNYVKENNFRLEQEKVPQSCVNEILKKLF